MPRSPGSPTPDTLPPGSGVNPDRDSDADEADELSDEQLGELLDTLTNPEDSEDELDGEDVDIGPQLETVSELDADDDGATDVGGEADELLPTDERERLDDDESSDLDVGESVERLSEATEPSGAEESEFDFIELGAIPLPALEVDDESEGVIELDPVPNAWLAGDEPKPLPSRLPWLALRTAPTIEACSAVASADGSVVAASSDLLWFAPGSLAPLRLEAGSSPIRSVAVLGSAWDYAVCATQSGRLLRRGRLTSASEELRRIREAADIPAQVREQFDLCQPGSAFPHALVVRTGRGLLLRSDDDGSTFRRVTEQLIRAVSAHGTPAVALTHAGTLLRSEDGGGSFTERALAPGLEDLTQSGEILIATHGPLLVLAEPTSRIAVSASGGSEFWRVSGTRGVSAVCAGDWQKQPNAWVALYDEAQDCTWLLRIDPAARHAETIAIVRPEAADSDDNAEHARVSQLVWDAVAQRLWAVGGFGVKVFAPPGPADEASITGSAD